MVAEAVAAERDGFAEAWSVHFSRSSDSLITLAAAAERTTGIGLGVGVVPTFPRHPAALAQSALTLQSLSGGRFTLGVGVSHGVVTWLAGPRSLEQVVVPAVTSAAAAVGRRAPRVIAAVPVAVDPDPVRGRSAASEVFARYGALPNYQRLFEREGVGGAADLALVGDGDDVSHGLSALRDAGATAVWAVEFDTGADVSRTRTVLSALAARGPADR